MNPTTSGGNVRRLTRGTCAWNLYAANHLRRISAIKFLSSLITEGIGDGKQRLWLERKLCEMANDRDDRVRVSSVKALMRCCATEQGLAFELYPIIKKLCDDTEKQVRIEALRILTSFADRYGEREVRENDKAMLLVDNAFAVVCHAVNDAEISVRAEAATLLGKFSKASDSFLLQTLDKKLLNAMRFSKTPSAPRRSQNIYLRKDRAASSSSVWSTGKKLGEDAPMEQAEEEQTSMIPTGACGAFVSTLEDEFMVVRQAGIRSLGILAADRPLFANMALDHLVDMFNDEIEEVRLDAIQALAPLVVHGVLQLDQLAKICTALDDKLLDSREALRLLLAKANLGTSECMKLCLKALLNCMRLYPMDRQPTYRCLSQLGRRHASLVLPLIDELLGLDPIFDITEPALEDVFYLAKLILILNAASEHGIICEYLPAFAVQHYRYLRLSMPSIVPAIPELAENDAEVSDAILSTLKKKVNGRHACGLLEKYYGKLYETTKMISYTEKRELYKRIKSDMDALCEMDDEVSGAAHFISNLLDIFSRSELVFQMIMFGGDLLTAFNVAEQGLTTVDSLEYGFTSVNGVLLTLAAELRFRLRLLAIASRLILCPGVYTNAEDVIAAELAALKNRLAEIEEPSMQSTQSLIASFEEICASEACDSKKCIDGRMLLRIFESHSVALPKKFLSLDGINIKWAEIIEPTDEDSDPIRFIAGLPVGVPFNVLLHNFDEVDLDKFRMKITYPDMSGHMFCPRKRDYRRLPSKEVRLQCDVCMVQSNAWSAAARVRVGCVFEVPSDCGIPLRNETVPAVPEVYLGRKATYIPVLESPYSDQQAAVEVSIYPMFKQC